jgi:hypothetical protein
MASAWRRRASGVAGLVLGCVGAAAAERERPVIEFEVESQYGDESDWAKGYLERAARVMVRMMDDDRHPPPKRIPVRLQKDPANPGVGGAASPSDLLFVSSSWPQEKFRYWILGHELANLLAHHYGGTGGYPSDWWSNGRSPYPLYVSTLVMAQLGYVEEAAWFRQHHRGIPDHELFWALHRDHGYDLFARFFKTVRADKVDFGKIGKPWPHPDRVRSLYAVAYLSIAAGENLAPVFRAHGIGSKPPDWDQRHPDEPFEGYTVSDETVQKVLDARKKLFEPPGSASATDAQRDKFRRGEAVGR